MHVQGIDQVVFTCTMYNKFSVPFQQLNTTLAKYTYNNMYKKSSNGLGYENLIHRLHTALIRRSL